MPPPSESANLIFIVVSLSLIDTEYDRAKVPLHNGNYPRLPLVV